MVNNILIREDSCFSFNHDNNGDMGVRISAIFVIFALSALGSFFPLISNHCKRYQLPSWVFFITKFFGSGVILATGFIHLLADASESLSDPCLGGTFEDYPWAEGIALMGLFSVFTFDAVAHRRLQCQLQKDKDNVSQFEQFSGLNVDHTSLVSRNKTSHYVEVNEEERSTIEINGTITKEKMLNCIILECGIVIHSIFIGLSLAVSNNEFVTLYIALCFHQFFEGLGLGTRFAAIQWPRNHWYVPWFMALIFSLSTPLATAIGLGIRNSFSIGSRKGLITAGIFDAACGGILIYNSIAELMGYDFIYASEFESMRSLISGIFVLGLGVLAMAVIGKWT